MRTILLVGTLGLVALACGDEEEKPIIIQLNNNNPVNNPQPNNPQPNNPQPNNPQPNNPQPNNINNPEDPFCPESARPIYAVEADVNDPLSQGKLVRFDAMTLEFTEIGELNCPVLDDETPFSMSVDRQGTAWVLYGSGDLYKVNTTDASCEATTYRGGQSGFWLFGMGFTLRTPGQPQETLFIAGGAGPGVDTPRLGTLSFPDFQVSEIGPISDWPEMSGTADAELWAFFPGSDPPQVSRLGSNGQVQESIPVDGIDGDPNAWAFAHWGGKFWLFYKSQTDESTRVFMVERDPVNVEEVVTNSGRYIVGAGVSTCAPTIFL